MALMLQDDTWRYHRIKNQTHKRANYRWIDAATFCLICLLAFTLAEMTGVLVGLWGFDIGRLETAGGSGAFMVFAWEFVRNGWGRFWQV